MLSHDHMVALSSNLRDLFHDGSASTLEPSPVRLCFRRHVPEETDDSGCDLAWLSGDASFTKVSVLNDGWITSVLMSVAKVDYRYASWIVDSFFHGTAALTIMKLSIAKHHHHLNSPSTLTIINIININHHRTKPSKTFKNHQHHQPST